MKKEKDKSSPKLDSLNKKIKFSIKPYLGYILNTCVSTIFAFVVLKMWITQYGEDLQEITNRHALLETRVKSIADSIDNLCTKLESITNELKSEKENSSYLYTSVASLQKDIELIKDEININVKPHDDSDSKALPPDKKEFIESLENLITDGAPFANFLTANSKKIEMKKYSTGEDLIKFSEVTVKSAHSIKNAFALVGVDVFDTFVEESFWEKQKRIIKDKILNAFKIQKKTNLDNLEQIPQNEDKSVFEAAHYAAKNGDFEKSSKILEKINRQSKELSDLILDLKKRSDLEKSFQKFKTEFIELESKTNITITK
jgi:hypothetical protein